MPKGGPDDWMTSDWNEGEYRYGVDVNPDWPSSDRVKTPSPPSEKYVSNLTPEELKAANKGIVIVYACLVAVLIFAGVLKFVIG